MASPVKIEVVPSSTMRSTTNNHQNKLLGLWMSLEARNDCGSPLEQATLVSNSYNKLPQAITTHASQTLRRKKPTH